MRATICDWRSAGCSNRHGKLLVVLAAESSLRSLRQRNSLHCNEDAHTELQEQALHTDIRRNFSREVCLVGAVRHGAVGDCLRDPLAAKEALEANLGDMQALCICDFRCCKRMSGAARIRHASPAYEN